MWSWGANDLGQLGDGTTADRNSPVPVRNAAGVSLTGISAIASAGNHTLALGAGGRVYTWGSNANGEAGIGSTQAFFNQAQLLPAPVNVFQVVAGENHCAVLDLSTRVWGWGDNTYGQLGDGTSGVARRQPVQTVGIPANAAGNLSASAHSGLVILVDGRSMVWGSNANGEFGVCSPTQALTAVAGPLFSGPGVLVTGAGVVFTANDQGNVSAWGGPDFLGYEPAPGTTTPSGGSCLPTALPACLGGSQPVSCPAQKYRQNEGATYVAANHLPAQIIGGVSASDIGAYGTRTTIDASQFNYGGKVVFDGRYHVRGTVRLTGGEFELRPGTVFVIDGLSGEPPPVASPNNVMRSAIEVESASLLLTGATLQANCDVMWAGVRLLNQGIIRTESSAENLIAPRRSSISDAEIGVEAVVAYDANGSYVRSTSEYYLTNTDFTNNSLGLSDLLKNVARPTRERITARSA